MRHFVINEANFCSPKIIPLYAKDLLEYNKLKSVHYSPGQAQYLLSVPYKNKTSATAATK